MAATQSAEPRECPYLMPAVPSGARPTIALYCRRPDGAVRVPRLDEARIFCLGARWRECPGVEHHAPPR